MELPPPMVCIEWISRESQKLVAPSIGVNLDEEVGTTPKSFSLPIPASQKWGIESKAYLEVYV